MSLDSTLPNVLMIVMDTARYRDTSFGQSSLDTTPTLQKLGAEGLVHDRMISAAPWTLPSHASLFTGTYPSTHGVANFAQALPNALKTLAEVLRKAGWQTWGVSNNAWVSHGTHLSRGFDNFYETWLSKHPSSLVQARGVARFVLRKPFGLADSGASWGVRKIADWVKRRGPEEAPFFVFANFVEPHLPYRPPGSYARRFTPGRTRAAGRVPQDWRAFCAGELTLSEDQLDLLRALYRGEIAYLDAQIGWLIEQLERTNVLDNTVVIVTSDHGENIGDHGLMDHQFSLSESLLHVPLVIRYPRRIAAGQRSESLAQTVDLFPTVLDLCGLDDPSVRGQVQGTSLVRDGTPRTFAVAEYDALGGFGFKRRYPDVFRQRFASNLTAFRTDRWKLIRKESGPVQLFDLEADPLETRDMASTFPDVAALLEGQLDSWLSQRQPGTGDDEGDMEGRYEKALEQRLRDLGYL